ncbi:MAG: ABC transporter ATP-binding protein [Bacteroidetes bacterium]|nr:MAG: ABC transporter ATP-binding protein [Bacteroidota bacterium]
MSLPVIEVENLSKKFVISHEVQEKYSSLRDTIAKQFSQITRLKKSKQQSFEEFYALHDINFQVHQGDRVGIIGRNGAGKSTLLKILSRITEPSNGRVKIRGRVASLLEVGTGFHPELTGRENIFLNGAILGMSRTEIRTKFDEIVDFAEIEKFLDTPVKRYSSGMYVRLAFAVAAHLEPEILVVDEVLAVGDSQFQKKCLGKMEDVSKNQGRTVLFVSHNMGVVSQLCKTAILLNKGSIVYSGNADGAIQQYLNLNMTGQTYLSDDDSKDFYIKSAEVLDTNGNICNNFVTSSKIVFKFRLNKKIKNSHVKLSCTIQSKTGDYLTTFVEELDNWFSEEFGSREFQVEYAPSILSPNSYAFRLAIFVPNGIIYDLVEMICPFSIIDEGTSMAAFEGSHYGYFFSNYSFVALDEAKKVS